MNEDGQRTAQPIITCTFEVDPSLKPIVESSHPFYAAITGSLTKRLADMMKTLGIPGQPSVEFRALENAGPQLLNARVNDQPCSYQNYIYQRIYAYVRTSIIEPNINFDVIWTWLRDLAQALSETAGDEVVESHPLVEFLTCACLEIIKLQPAVLVGLEQVEAIKQLLLMLPSLSVKQEEERTEEEWPSSAWLQGIFTRVLQQNISLADLPTIGTTLFSMRDRSQEEVAEELITMLSADILEIHLSQNLLRTFTTAYARYAHSHLRNVRQSMTQKYGVRLPEMRFVLNEELKPGSFACKVNSLLLLPWMVVPEDALEYIETLLLVDVREKKNCFVHRRAVEQLLAPCKQSSPLVFRLASSQLPLYRITQVLRILVGEEVSIRNLVPILEQLLNYKYIEANPALPLSFEDMFPVVLQEEGPSPDHPTHLASFVRLGLKRAISYQYAGEQRQLYSYVFQNERVVEEALPVLHNYSSQEQPNPPGTQPVVITSISVRSAFQELINIGAFPYIPVLAYQELIRGLHIQLVEKVAVDTTEASHPVDQRAE